jgi:hypothetical protein
LSARRPNRNCGGFLLHSAPSSPPAVVALTRLVVQHAQRGSRPVAHQLRNLPEIAPGSALLPLHVERIE